MASQNGNGDLIDEILKDHAEIESLFAEVEASSGKESQRAFEALVRKLVVHETAEQELVHPLLKQAGREVQMEHRIAEERQGEQMLAELLQMGTGDARFAARFSELKLDVVKHAGLEERDEHPTLRAEVDANRLRRLAKAFRVAEAAAPTRPHPHGPKTPAGKMATGPLIALVDRTRDAMRDALAKLGS